MLFFIINFFQFFCSVHHSSSQFGRPLQQIIGIFLVVIRVHRFLSPAAQMLRYQSVPVRLNPHGAWSIIATRCLRPIRNVSTDFRHADVGFFSRTFSVCSRVDCGRSFHDFHSAVVRLIDQGWKTVWERNNRLRNIE